MRTARPAEGGARRRTGMTAAHGLLLHRSVMRELGARDGTCSLPTLPPRFAPEEWSRHLADRNLDHAWGDCSPLELGRAMPNECWLQREAPRLRCDGVLHPGSSITVGSVRRDLHGAPRFPGRNFHPSFLGFDAPSHWAASRPQAGIRESHGGNFVMHRASVATSSVDASSVARTNTEPPCVLDIDNTYEANRSRRCDATSFVCELHLSVPERQRPSGTGAPAFFHSTNRLR